MESKALAGSVVTLYRESSENEVREVKATFDGGGYLLLGERSEGELSLSAYGTPSHYHQLVISPESLGQLAEELGVSPQGDGSSVLNELGRYFRNTGAFLSELMDRLDVAGISYGYLPAAGTALVSYRPARRSDGSSY